jgi:glycosyltransferase involved in cell wall biosynthesis
MTPRSVLMLAPPAASSGPTPRILALLTEALRAKGVRVEHAAWGREPQAAGSLANARARLLQAGRILVHDRRTRSDLIVIQTSFETRSIVLDLPLVLLLRMARRRVVLQFHGGDADRLSFGKYPFFAGAGRAILRLANGVFVLSSEEQRLLRDAAPRATVFVTANPFVTRETSDAPRRGESGGAFSALFAGRLLLRKGILDVIDAVAVARIDTLRLVVAGDGPAAEAVKSRIAAAGLQNRVSLLGHVPPDALGEAYRQADVFVFPTYHPEGFPTVIAEAMAAGLPIISTATRGIGDHLVDGKNAIFVPPRDPPAIARALEELHDSPAKARAMGDANRSAVEAFSPDAVAAAYLEDLAKIAAHGRPDA